METKSFRDLAIQYHDQDYIEYHQAIVLLESHNGIISEGILDTLSAGIKSKLDFIKQLADTSKISIDKAVEFFKNAKAFKFFKMISFDMSKLFKMVKEGYKAYISLHKIVAEYVASQGAVKWTKGKLHELDLFLEEHPILKKLGGVAVGGILIYIWLNMSFSGDLKFDMDFDDILLALSGRYSLGDLFASEQGVRMLLLLATGTVLGLSFPWPGNTMIHFIGGVVFSLQKLIRAKL